MSEKPRKLRSGETDLTSTPAYAAAKLLNMHYDALPNERERLAESPEQAGDQPAEAAKTASEAELRKDVLASLRPEQREKAQAAITAMVEKFSGEKRRLSAEDFGVVLTGEGDRQKVVVMLTAGNGLYKGSFNNIMANNDDFTIDINGHKVDCRQAMTYELYEAFINGQKSAGVKLLPDSEPLSEQNGEPWTATWLTGEAPDGFSADYGDVFDGQPYRDWYDRDRDGDRLRVRPAVEI